MQLKTLRSWMTYHFAMNVLNHRLISVKAPCFCILNLVRESHIQIFIDNAVRCGKERQDMTYKVSLVLVELVLPVAYVLRKIDLFSGPERSLSL